ncbi:hypothetical protein ABL78_1537 [Leptomonas seymouri]|uniref:Uncharacterized protein n=1 Tax=Leptomonas seymouri TaxID=5684 RepID=A0A0N1PDL2_LEPSE|nr:hypothetical protein ABL78_1537 [Leptomonas seymouri]|eukprot:KPI89308.1 hypothetical protein ABL78_1537 [Leptomonas seymouri]
MPSRADIIRICDWLNISELYSWLPLPNDQLSTTAATHNWLSSIWCPPASESAYHSLTYSVGPSSALLSEIEKDLANAAAHQLGLPKRFYWPTAADPRSVQMWREGAKSPSPSPQLRSTTPASATTLMLWPTAMRTTTGDTVPRPPSSSGSSSVVALTAALPTLPAIATARQVFAPVPRTPTKPSSISSSSASTSSAPEEISAGGGLLFSLRLEAYMVLLLTARKQALTRSSSQNNAFSGPEAAARQLDKLVLYAGDQVDPLLLRAAQLIGIPHLRVLQTVAGDRQLPLPRYPQSPSSGAADEETVVHHYNYTLDVTRLQSRLVEDVAAGMYPVMVVGTFGSGLSGAVDPVAALGAFCKRLGVWYHIDASQGGTALLASRSVDSHQRSTHHSASAQLRLRAFAGEFQSAALTADSVLLPAGGSALPYPILPGYALRANGRSLAGAALLFVAHVRKVAWSVQSLGESRQSTFNQYVTPGVSDSDVLHVSSLAHSCGWLADQAAEAASARVSCCMPRGNEDRTHRPAEDRNYLTSALHPSTGASTTLRHVDAAVQRRWASSSTFLAQLVAQHQEFTFSVLRSIRSDGRFDASLDASLFGMVRLRWLTAADEATSELARAWADELHAGVREAAMEHRADAPADATEGSPARGDGSQDCVRRDVPLVRVYVGVVQLQRRLWVTLCFGALPHSIAREEAARNPTSCESTMKEFQEDYCSSSTLKETEAYVLRTLDQAARRVKPDGVA